MPSGRSNPRRIGASTGGTSHGAGAAEAWGPAISTAAVAAISLRRMTQASATSVVGDVARATVRRFFLRHDPRARPPLQRGRARVHRCDEPEAGCRLDETTQCLDLGAHAPRGKLPGVPM